MVDSDPLPPGPPWPALQSIRYGVDPHGFFESAHRSYGDVFTVRPVGETWVIVADPDAARELLAHGADDLDSGAANQALAPLLGTRNVLLLDGDEHLRRRRLVLPPFHGARLRAYEALIRATTRRVVSDWPVDVAAATLPRMQAITLHVVLRAVFGVEEGERLTRLGAMLRRLLNWTAEPVRALVFAFLGPERLTQLPAFAGHVELLDRELLAEIAERRVAPDLTEREDILSLLLSARDEDGEALSDGELRDELVTLLVAGHETTAAALSWALVELARDREAQAGLAAGEPGLAEAAVSETLRLHPPVPLGGVRRLRRPLTIAGWDLPEGATVAPCSLLLHRRPDIYAEPDRWRVDRFLLGRPPGGAFVPFGGGVRRCVGAAFAQFEARIVLEELLGALELEPAEVAMPRTARRGIVLVPAQGGAVIAARRVSAASARVRSSDHGAALAGHLPGSPRRTATATNQ